MIRVKLPRSYAGFTEKAVNCLGFWVPRRFVINWPGEKPPETVICDLPEWLYELNRVVIENYKRSDEA